MTLLATILHPVGRDLFGSFSVSRANRVMLALVVVASLPLLAFAWINVGPQRTVTNGHATLGHYGFMAALSFTVIAVGLLATTRPVGWLLAAWAAGFLPILLGVASLLYPAVDSRLSRMWSAAAIVWGVAFVAAAQIARRQVPGQRLSPGSGVPPPRNVESTPRTPRWLTVVGILVVILALVFGIVHLTGGGFARHTQ